MKKTEIVYVNPKNEKSKEIFEVLMYKLHSCKVIKKSNGKIYLKSIVNNYDFYVNEYDDTDWEFIK